MMCMRYECSWHSYSRIYYSGADPNKLQGMKIYKLCLRVSDVILVGGRSQKRLETVQMVLDHGADTGKMVKRPGGSIFNTMYTCCLHLKSKKGCAAVNIPMQDEEDSTTDTHSPLHFLDPR